ncbi:MAG: paraquat-inducible protein A [Desulfobacterales bacterium]
MTASPRTARQAGMAACEVCLLLSPRSRSRCPRCRSPLHSRKPQSISRTWALLIAALLFYFPANLLPMTTVVTLGRAQSDTILSGVVYFIQTGSWPIAAVIFIASILVPLLKIGILAFLLVSVQRGSTYRPLERTRLYRITELVGRWSMLDIFVVTVLVALVNLGALASIQAGPAAPFFAAVVVLTMFAAMSFDPRLIWDRCSGEESDD